MTAEPALVPLFWPRDPDRAREISLVSADVRVDVRGVWAEVAAVQRFRNEGASALDAVLLAPSDERGVLLELAVDTGTGVHHVEVRRARSGASGEAVDASAAGSDVPRETASVPVRSVAPGAEVQVRYRALVPVPFESGEATIALPLAMVPCGYEGGAVGALALVVDLDAGAPLEELRSNTPVMEITRRGESTATARLRAGSDGLGEGGAVALTWTLREQAEGVPVVVSARGDDGVATVAVAALPPPVLAEDAVLPRDVVVMLDRSAGMEGEGYESARRAVRGFLRSLGPRDTFAVVAYGGKLDVLPPASFHDPALDAADDFLFALTVRGAPALGPALAAALVQPVRSDALRTLLWVTGGQCTDAVEAMARVREAVGAENVRAHAVGAGVPAGAELVREFARAGRGLCEWGGGAGEIEPAMLRWSARAGAPVLTDVAIALEGVGVEQPAPAVQEDLCVGHGVAVCARASGHGALRVRATGRDARGGLVQVEREVRLPAEKHGQEALVALWASAHARDAESEAEAATLALAHGVSGPGTSAWLVDATGQGDPLLRPTTTSWAVARSSARAARRNVVPTAIAPAGAAQPPRAVVPGSVGPGVALDVQGLDDGPAESTQRYDGAAYAREVERRLAARERIDAGLRFLARCQSAAGAWSDVETTRLVLAAFRSAGETARRGRYRRQLGRAEGWLARGAQVRSAPTMQPLNKLIAGQVLGGPNDGAVLGHGDAIAMTAMLVSGLVLSEAGAL